jgi:large subunit ribosomal protein L35
MPKCKTNKTAAKRFKLTGTGKLMYQHSHLNHLMFCKKDGGRTRRMRQDGQLDPGDLRKAQRLLPNGL